MFYEKKSESEFGSTPERCLDAKSLKYFLDTSNSMSTLFTLPNGYYYNFRSIIPIIVDVKIFPDENNPKIVKVFFNDDTFTSATVNKEDVFDLETGIGICLSKKMLEMLSYSSKGNYLYNRLIKTAMQVYKKNKKEESELEERLRLNERRKERNRIRKEKRVNKKREREIEIQTEAYIRAMKKIAQSGNN